MQNLIIANFQNQSRAQTLSPEQRKELAIGVLSKAKNISELSRQEEVSRKFLYNNAELGDLALRKAYHSHDGSEEKVLFHLPITKQFIHQFVLAQVFVCHAPFRGVVTILKDVFDYSVSLGTVHNIVRSAVPTAREINLEVPLQNIQVAAHDEIFQCRKPVLVGVDAESTYCYLLEQEEHRDETTWGVHLLDLQERGLAPDHVIADFGKGLRAGQKEAWPQIPCWGDIFHPLMDLGKLLRFLEGRVNRDQKALASLEKKMERKKKKKQGHTLGRKLGNARIKARKAVHTFEVVSTLANWMQHDIFGLNGPSFEDRQELFDFVVEELKRIESNCEHRILPIRRLLEQNKENLLLFAKELEEKLMEVSEKWDVGLDVVYELSETLGLNEERSLRWIRQGHHYDDLGERYEELMEEVKNALLGVIRASSMVENLNSRLRNYFFLRRHLGDEYLCLLQFYLNHARYRRSHRTERKGKSPKELLLGESHAHWLELLGFERFKRS